MYFAIKCLTLRFHVSNKYVTVLMQTTNVSVDGKVFGWGSNGSGQLGFTSNKEAEVLTPTLIYTLSERVVKEVACGESHTAFVTGD